MSLFVSWGNKKPPIGAVRFADPDRCSGHAAIRLTICLTAVDPIGGDPNRQMRKSNDTKVPEVTAHGTIEEAPGGEVTRKEMSVGQEGHE